MFERENANAEDVDLSSDRGYTSDFDLYNNGVRELRYW